MIAGRFYERPHLVKFSRMKATFDINEIVLRELREAAVREDIAASVLVEAALREFLASKVGRTKKFEPLPSWDIGTDLVDVSDRDALCAAMEEEE